MTKERTDFIKIEVREGGPSSLCGNDYEYHFTRGAVIVLREIFHSPRFDGIREQFEILEDPVVVQDTVNEQRAPSLGPKNEARSTKHEKE